MSLLQTLDFIEFGSGILESAMGIFALLLIAEDHFRYNSFGSLNLQTMQLKRKIDKICWFNFQQWPECNLIDAKLYPYLHDFSVPENERNALAEEVLLKNFNTTLSSISLDNHTSWNMERPFFAKRSPENLELILKYDNHCSHFGGNDCKVAAEKLHGALIGSGNSFEQVDSKVREAAKDIDFIQSANLTDKNKEDLEIFKFAFRNSTNMEFSLKMLSKCKFVFDLCPNLNQFMRTTLTRKDLTDEAKDKLIFDHAEKNYQSISKVKLPEEQRIMVDARRFKDYKAENKELMDKIDFCIDRDNNNTMLSCMKVSRQIYSVFKNNATLSEDQKDTAIFSLVEPYEFLHKSTNSAVSSTNSTSEPSQVLSAPKALHASNFDNTVTWSISLLAISIFSTLAML